MPTPAQSSRVLSLDVLRGLTIAAMILVTDPGTYSFRYAPICHADWDHPTPTDMIFPIFLVVVGISLTLSFAARLNRGTTRRQLFFHALQRAAILILLGLFLNALPDFHLATLRLSGILQRIAICYLLSAGLYLALTPPHALSRHSPRLRALSIAFTIFALLLTYWLLLKLVPTPGFGPGYLDSYTSLPAWLDRAIITVPHLWPYGTTPGHGVTFDPEGILSTLGALATTLLGVLAGDWLQTLATGARKAANLFSAGVLLALTGFLLSPSLPLIKKLWTPTFALYSGGIALAVFALLYFLIDVKLWRRSTSPAVIFGTNAIFAFALSTVVTIVTDRLHIGPLTLHKWLYAHAFLPWLQPINASLAYAILIVAFNLALVYPLYRNRIFLRV